MSSLLEKLRSLPKAIAQKGAPQKIGAPEKELRFTRSRQANPLWIAGLFFLVLGAGIVLASTPFMSSMVANPRWALLPLAAALACWWAALHLPQDRVYDDFNTMMTAEAALPENERMQFVAIVTPNHMHYPVAEAALRAGFHVMSDKPATFNLEEALRLRDIVEETGLLYGLTHTYTGYPLVKEARERVAAGQLGTVRKVVVEYPQGWLADRQEDEDNKQAAWRLDPQRAGMRNSLSQRRRIRSGSVRARLPGREISGCANAAAESQITTLAYETRRSKQC